MNPKKNYQKVLFYHNNTPAHLAKSVLAVFRVL